MTTFAALGIPFPLFEAPVTSAAEYLGVARCGLCGASEVPCFTAGIGDSIAIPCFRCAAEVFLRADERRPGQCPRCNRQVPFPRGLSAGAVPVCYGCLR